MYRTKNSIVFKDIHFYLEDKELIKLYEEGKIKACLIVEASASVYREMFELTDKPTDITVPIHLLKGDVYVSSYIYANENIEGIIVRGFEVIIRTIKLTLKNIRLWLQMMDLNLRFL